MGTIEKFFKFEEKIEGKIDEAIQKNEDKKIKETWYVSVTDNARVVRVVQRSESLSSKILFRNIEKIQGIENTSHFVLSGDENLVYDTRNPHCNSEELIENIFKNHFSLLTDETRKQQLEARYQEVLNVYGDRMEAYKVSMFNHNTEESQRRLDGFLNRTSAEINNTMQIRELDADIVEEAPERQSFSDSIQTNAYGGSAEIPLSLMPDEYKQALKENKEKEEDKQISKNTKKRLESIE